jgi:predicted ATPase
VLFVLTGASGSGKTTLRRALDVGPLARRHVHMVLDWIAAQQRSTPPLSGPWWD